MKRFTFHIIPNPYIPVSYAHTTDAFTQLTIKACRMLTNRKHVVHFYGLHCNNSVDCAHDHQIVEKSLYRDYKRLTSNYTHPCTMVWPWSEFCKAREKIFSTFYQCLLKSLNAHYAPGDIVLHMVDLFHEKDFFSCKLGKTMIHISFSKGGHACLPLPYAVFSTEDHKAVCSLAEPTALGCLPLIKPTHSVILPWFYPEDFIFRDSKTKATPILAMRGSKTKATAALTLSDKMVVSTKEKKRYLFLARCQKWKGLHKFLQFSKHFPKADFIIAGGSTEYNSTTRQLVTADLHNDKNVTISLQLYPNVIYLGPVKKKKRAKLLAQVTALIQPTLYREPCGWNAIEAMFSGTPVIAPDFGGFVNTVQHGVTGYLCTPQTWITNIARVHFLDRRVIWQYACSTFSETRAYQQYYSFFKKIVKIAKFKDTIVKVLPTMTKNNINILISCVF
jgi:glycosyltransferase involved in cell wall biosynthesis